MATVLYVIFYKYSLNLLQGGMNDLIEHTLHAENIHLATIGDSWLQRPYLFWHLTVKGLSKFFGMPIDAASACANGLFAGFTGLLVFYLLDRVAEKLTGREAGISAAVVSGVLSFVMPLYVPWFNTYQYEGQFSPNPIFNPTHMAVKPFGILCFMLAADLILAYKGEERLFFPGIRREKWLYVWFAFALLLSAFAKPAFMYMLLPAGFVYLLIDLGFALWKKDGSHKKVWGCMWRIACASIPALLYLLSAYVAISLWGGTNDDASVAVYPFLTAWRIYSPNVARSIRLAMAFPIWMVLTNLKYFGKSVEGRFALIAYLTGTLEFSFFVETGEKLTHLNFAWPMMSGMLLLWVVSGARLAALTVRPAEHKWEPVLVTVGWILLAIHFFSGLYYINPYAYLL